MLLLSLLLNLLSLSLSLTIIAGWITFELSERPFFVCETITYHNLLFSILV